MPLLLVDPFAQVDSATTTNSFGIDRTYDLGVAQIWNADIQRDLPRNLTVSLGYTGTKGTSLDIQRAPNRNPDGGLRIEDVQPFLWQSSEGRSTLHSLTVRARKRLSRGISFGGAYVLVARLRQRVVFWRRRRDRGAERPGSRGRMGPVELRAPPRGQRRLHDRAAVGHGPALAEQHQHARAALRRLELERQPSSRSPAVRSRRASPATSSTSGSGVNGTLRADYDGSDISVSDPTTLRYFNTDAFSIPAPGTFGNAARNLIIGPGSHNLNMNLSKNVNFGRTRGVNIRVQASNVLNTVQFSSIDTVVNSPTFGQVTAVRPMRSVQLILRFRF